MKVTSQAPMVFSGDYTQCRSNEQYSVVLITSFSVVGLISRSSKTNRDEEQKTRDERKTQARMYTEPTVLPQTTERSCDLSPSVFGAGSEVGTAQARPPQTLSGITYSTCECVPWIQSGPVASSNLPAGFRPWQHRLPSPVGAGGPPFKPAINNKRPLHLAKMAESTKAAADTCGSHVALSLLLAIIKRVRKALSDEKVFVRRNKATSLTLLFAFCASLRAEKRDTRLRSY